MHKEPYQLTEQELVAQNERMFNWSLRTGEQLTNIVIADSRLSSHFWLIKRLARSIARESQTALLMVEAIPYKWELDSNYSSIKLRWRSSEGTFCRVFLLEPGQEDLANLDLLDPSAENPLPGVHVISPWNPYKPRPGQPIAYGL